MKKILLALFILFIYIALAPAAFAQVPQQFLQVSPSIEDLALTPGQNISYPLVITNNGDKPVGFHVEITDIDPTTDDSFQFGHHSPFLSWISASPTELIVAPHEKNAFTITIAPPSTAKQSGYYATIFLTPFMSNPPSSSGPIILERIGTLLFGTVGTLDYQRLSQKTTLNASFDTWVFPSSLQVKVSNTYFTHFTAKPFITISSLTGKETTFMPEEKHVLPNSTRVWNYPLSLHWYTLYQNIKIAISIGGGYQIKTQITYVNFPLIMCVAILISLGLFLERRKSQLKKALRILLFGHN